VSWLRRSGLNWAILALLIVAFGAFLWIAPERQVSQKEVPGEKRLSEEKRLALVNEYRRTWAQILGGAALLGGLYFTWRTLRVNREGQITERFTRAIDQLGAKDDEGNLQPEIRLGGIYALERIASDSPERDYGTVMNVLTAYVRQHAPWSKADPERSENEEQANPWILPSPPADIQAILGVLGRRKDSVRKEYQVRLDLHGTHLQGADLKKANLQDANFFRANLHRVEAEEANLHGANLQSAILELAFLQGADLREADLHGANLKRAKLFKAKVTDEQLRTPTSLEEATMPNGQMYEDWLKDEKASGEDEKRPRGEHLVSEEPGTSKVAQELRRVPALIRYGIYLGLGLSVAAALGYLLSGMFSQAAPLASLHFIFGQILQAALTFTLIAVGGGYIKYLGDRYLEEQRQHQTRLKELEDRRHSIIEAFVDINSGFYKVRKRLESKFRPESEESKQTLRAEMLDESVDLESQYGTLKIRAIRHFKLPAGEYGTKDKNVMESKLEETTDSREKARLRLDLLSEYYDGWRKTLEKDQSKIPTCVRKAVWKHYEALLLYFEESALEEDNRTNARPGA
jgi:Pentapeptide repeats (8 copies)